MTIADLLICLDRRRKLVSASIFVLMLVSACTRAPPQTTESSSEAPSMGPKYGNRLEPAFKRPDAVLNVPKSELEARVKANDDLVVLDGKDHFIRGVLSVPVVGEDRPLGIGVWVHVSKSDFDDYYAIFDAAVPANHKGYTGTLANEVSWLPQARGLPVLVRLIDQSSRPSIAVDPSSMHALAIAQRDGIDPQTADAWSRAPSREIR